MRRKLKGRKIFVFLVSVLLAISSVVITFIRLLNAPSTFITVFSMTAESLGVCIMATFIHGSLLSNDITKRKDYSFTMFLNTVCFALFFDFLNWTIDGLTSDFFVSLNYIVTSLYYVLNIFSVYVFAYYLKNHEPINKNGFKIFTVLCKTYMFILCGFLIVNLFTGWIFTIENGYYTPQILSWVFYPLTGVFIILIMFTVKYKEIPLYNRLSLWFYVSFPIIGVLLEQFVVKMAFLGTCTVLSVCLLFAQIYRANELTISLEEEENERKKNKILLTQMQPHFVYNSLTTIQYLCETNPKEASILCEKFSNYLRNNVDSFEDSGVVPFEKELKNIENYIYIEKARFGDRINVIYDLKETNFNVPVLCVQTIVENAIKHGILKKKQGGTVKISSYIEDNYYVIIIEDDGVGFNLEEIKNDGKYHVGLKAVKQRVIQYMNGIVSLDSVIGRGTIFTIKIPRGDE